MRHWLAAISVALVLAVVLVLVIAGGDDVADDVQPVTTPAPTEPDEPETVETTPPAEPDERPSERAQVERAVVEYVEAAERGEAEGEGLPTSDELSIGRTRISGDRARVRLVGGAVLVLVRRGGRWRVERVIASIPEPTPPSGPP